MHGETTTDGLEHKGIADLYSIAKFSRFWRAAKHSVLHDCLCEHKHAHRMISYNSLVDAAKHALILWNKALKISHWIEKTESLKGKKMNKCLKEFGGLKLS